MFCTCVFVTHSDVVVTAGTSFLSSVYPLKARLTTFCNHRIFAVWALLLMGSYSIPVYLDYEQGFYDLFRVCKKNV